MKTLKLFEDFEEEEDDSLFLPGDDDYDYVDMEDDEEFEEFKNEIYADFKYSSEKVLEVIGIENETEWWKYINDIAHSKNNEDLQIAVVKIREFLNKFDIKQINSILNDE